MISYTPPGPIGEAFIKDDSFISGLMGPVGSGKSSAAIFKLFYKGLTQTPYERVRYSRWTCIRNTYGELESTTIRTFKDWFGEDIAPMKMGSSPIEAKMDFWLPDKTRVKMEWWFLALNRPDDLGKMRSLETTGIWINEASEVGKAIADKATERVGRYPKMAWGGADWAGVVMDTNPPDDDHWWYELFENPNKDEHAMVMENLRSRGVLRKDQPYQRIFKQPGGLTLEGGAWRENPNAENVTNLRGGFGYYWQQFPNKTDNWRKVFLGGNYGSIAFGKPVYPEYNDDLHCKEIKPYADRPLILGFDYGLTPACVIMQVSPRGQVRVLDELVSFDMGIRQFAGEVLKPFLAQNYAGFAIQAVGDPAGMSKSQTEERTCFMELADAGIPAMPAITNEPTARREAVAKYLTTLTDGQPAFIVHPRCKTIRKGFNGSYKYDRVQVMAEERYKDRPAKNEYSHCFVADTLISTPRGFRPIETLRVGDRVNTPLGPRTITATMSREAKGLLQVIYDGGKLLCTPDHPFILENKISRADALQYGDVLISADSRQEKQWADLQSTQFRYSTQFVTTSSLLVISSAIQEAWLRPGIFTGRFGRALMAASRLGWPFITRITTRPTTTSPISSSFPSDNTLDITAGSVQARILRPPRATWRPSAPPLRSGMPRQKARLGTKSTANAPGYSGRTSNTAVSIVAASIGRLREHARRGIARLLARVQPGVLLASTMKPGHALFASALLRLTGTPKHLPAPRIVGVKPFPEASARVYDLTVEGAHCFYANGVLVSNCHDALQYACLHARHFESTSWTGGKDRVMYPKLSIA